MTPDRVVPPVLVTVKVRLAPPKSTPPLKVRPRVPPTVKSPPTATVLLRVLAAPLACRVPPFNVRVPVPKAALLPAARVPSVRVVPPAKVLAPDRVREPLPALVREPLEMTPDKVVLPALLTVKVRLAPPKLTAPLRVRLSVAAPPTMK